MGDKTFIKEKFGRLIILRVVGVTKSHGFLVRCRCDCGKEFITRKSSVVTGHTKSCGCLHGGGNLKHGMRNTTEYTIWKNMKDRCNNPNCKAYPHYGGRGITVCKEWLNSFEAFFKDMGICPDELTLERIDNDKGYYKGNCKWATWTEQNRNTRIQKNNKTGVKDVHWAKSKGKYVARISVNSMRIHLGTFVTLEEAAMARKEGEIKYFGQGGRL